MEFPPNVFSSEQSSYLARVLRELDLRNQEILRLTKVISSSLANNGVTVTAASTVVIPDNCDYFVLNGATSVNVFSSKPAGSYLKIRLNAGTTLINSVNLILKDSINRVSITEGIVELISFGSGIWKEIGDNIPSVIDLTGYTGADFRLCIGQLSKKTISSVSTILLRTLCATNEIYKIKFVLNRTSGVDLALNPTLQVNNANFGSNVCFPQRIDGTNTTAIGDNFSATGKNNFFIAPLAKIDAIEIIVNTRTEGKTVTSNYTCVGNTQTISGTITNICTDTITPITSLGTINLQTSQSGICLVERVL